MGIFSCSLHQCRGLLKGESHVMELLIFCMNLGQAFSLSNKKQANLIALGMMPQADGNSSMAMRVHYDDYGTSGKMPGLCTSGTWELHLGPQTG